MTGVGGGGDKNFFLKTEENENELKTKPNFFYFFLSFFSSSPLSFFSLSFLFEGVYFCFKFFSSAFYFSGRE